MRLTGIILFCGSVFAMLIWLYSLYMRFGSLKIWFQREILGQNIEINVLVGIAIFIWIAISAGMAWG